MTMIKQATIKAINREHLSEPEMKATMEEILTGKTTSAQVGAFLAALRMKGRPLRRSRPPPASCAQRPARSM
jgi:anthranilate phosphoribosyltransferase